MHFQERMINLIEATFKPTSFRIEGHANYAPHGYDIICAGVSALVDGLVNACNEIGLPIGLDVTGGFVEVEFMQCNELTDAIYTVLKQGVKSIAIQYPKYLTVVGGDST